MISSTFCIYYGLKCNFGFLLYFKDAFFFFLGLQHSRKDRLRNSNARRNMETPFSEHSEGSGFTCS